MAQGGSRPRHERQGSRFARLGGRLGGNVGPTDDTLAESERQTISYIKRVLCAGKTGNSSTTIDATPLDELLPSLTSSNDLDVQLYAIIAVILSQFVHSWYARITNDRAFTQEVLNIIAHCTRGVEQRFQQVDLESLLLDELPALFLAHMDAAEIAFDACSDDRSEDHARVIFHSLRPTQATSPAPTSPSDLETQKDNEIAWCQLLVSRILPLVLPPEDLQNPCLYVFVSEIFSQAILYNAICERASEAWVIWEGVTKLIRIFLLPTPAQQALTTDGAEEPSMNRLRQFGLLASAGATPHANQTVTPSQRRSDSISHTFWMILYLISAAWELLRSIAKALMHASSIPARPPRQVNGKASNKLSLTAVESNEDSTSDLPPVVQMRIWPCMARLTALEHRMPWLSGLISLLQWISLNGPGQVCRPNGAVDRLLSSKIRAKLLNHDLLPRLLLGARAALFPNNAMAPTRQPPTSDEVLQIKRDCAQAIVDAIPAVVRNRYFATKDLDLMRQDVERTLHLFSDPYINRHFIVSALELFAVRLFPELEANVDED